MKKIILYILIAITSLSPLGVEARRVATIGFEQNTTDDGVECEFIAGTGVSTTTDAYSGNYAYTASTAQGFCQIYIDYVNETFATTTISMRFKYSSDGSSQAPILSLNDAGASVVGNILLTTNDALRLRKPDLTQIGSDYSILAFKNKWITIQLQAGSGNLTGRVCTKQATMVEMLFGTFACAETDFVTFASGANTFGTNGVAVGHAGLIGTSVGATIWWDDVKLNTATGLSASVDPEQSWPNDWHVAYVRPDGAGSSNQWQKSDGSAGDANNYQSVDEFPPDDGTTLLEADTANDSDFYAMSVPTLSTLTQVGAMQFNIRFINESQPVVAVPCLIQVQAKAASSGTATTSAAISVSDNSTWFTNSTSEPVNPVLTLYKDPDGNAWTTGTLQSLQAGMVRTADSCNQLPNVSAMWVVYDYFTQFQPANIVNGARKIMNGAKEIINL
jgi:hypothetical protein